MVVIKDVGLEVDLDVEGAPRLCGGARWVKVGGGVARYCLAKRTQFHIPLGIRNDPWLHSPSEMAGNPRCAR